MVAKIRKAVSLDGMLEMYSPLPVICGCPVAAMTTPLEFSYWSVTPPPGEAPYAMNTSHCVAPVGIVSQLLAVFVAVM